MRYVSTRGGMAPARFCSILLEGLAPDGGLVVPERYPVVTLKDLHRWADLPYAELAFEVIRRYTDDIPEADLRRLLERTYTAEVFGTEAITPIKTLEPGLHLLALSNGPTLAFKDLPMQFLGHLFEYVLSRSGQQLNILGATSGDTGSAAEYAMRGKRGVRVFNSTDVRSECSCSRPNVEAMLRNFSQDDRDHMVENGVISVTCEFCSSTYLFDPDEVAPA